MNDLNINSTEIEQLTFHRGTEFQIDSYCYHTKYKDDLILCKIINFISEDECCIIDLMHMNQYVVYTKHLSIIDNDQTLKKAQDLNKRYLTKMQPSHRNSDSENKTKYKVSTRTRTRTKISPIWVFTFLCLLLCGIGASCFWRASIYFNHLSDYRESTTTKCNITNYTVQPCQYKCEIEGTDQICNGTTYTFYAIAQGFCDDQILQETEKYHLCPEKQITEIIDTPSIYTCFVVDCSDGFHLFPPYEHVDLNFAGLFWMLIGYLIGVCGFFCGLYACGEYIATLGTYDIKSHDQPNDGAKCCKRRRLETMDF